MQCLEDQGDVELSWNMFSKIACYSMEKLLRKQPPPFTPEQQLAYQEYKNLMQRLLKPRDVDKNPNLIDPANDFPPLIQPGSRELLRAALNKVHKATIDSKATRMRQFLQDLNEDAPCPGQRLYSALNFIKGVKRSQCCSSQITIAHWENELKKKQGPSIPLLSEDDFFPMLKPPSYVEVEQIVMSFRNGKAPGFDKVHIEMLKASAALRYQLYRFIKKAYLINDVPSSWHETYSFPIPKIKSPKDINDYRLLTMCSKAYQVYAKVLANYLSPYLPNLDGYQCGFEANRSCDDVLFTIRRILEEHWNKGQRTFIFSFDIRKAFDSVLISRLPHIFLKYGVPKYLINRIITAILTENNCLLWKGQYTQWFEKVTGIKQGCVLSPKLFNLIMDEAIQSVKQYLLTLGIHLYTAADGEILQCPAIFGYADDINLITTNLEEGIFISELLLLKLREFGLELNANKSGLLVKGYSGDIPDIIEILQQQVPQVQTIKLLGTYINADMTRKAAIKPRVNQTTRLFKSFIPHLRELQLPMDLLMDFYSLVIVPSAVYGLKSMSMTKQNMQTLMRREIMMIKDLTAIASPPPPCRNVVKSLHE